MCFSASVSFITAGALTVIGLMSLYISRTHTERLLSLTPIFFAAQQTCEGVLWLTLPAGNGFIAYLATYIYLFFVIIFWPLWMPIVVSFYEREWLRKIGMYLCAIAGACVALYSLRALLIAGAHAEIEYHHIRYIFNLNASLAFILLVNALYCVATLIPLLICSRPRVWILGATLAASYVVSHIFYYACFTSVWCFFGALLSFLTLYIIYYNHTIENKHREL